MSGSKTKYYVDSSTFPMFDPGERINQYQAAMLDYTANSPIEMSEYMNQYYGGSKLRNLRGYLRWCDSQGFTKTFGKINSSFYGDAVIDNSLITTITKGFVDLKSNDEYQVYNTALNFFSEDFYIKYLATQQGVANWVYQESDINYTIDYPDDNTIRAMFKDGRVIQGALPSYSPSSRFLEISYSILTTEEIITEIPPVLDTLGNVIEEGYTQTRTEYKYTYGYIHYKEGSGNTSLDEIIKFNGITGEKTFYPVVPIRTNTAWFTGTKANMINEALKYLDIYNPSKGKNDAYKQLQTMLVDGMKDGSIGDIDYITLLLGVSINTTHQSDLKYLYEFFFNLHTNYALAQGGSPTDVYEPKNLSSGSNAIGTFANKVIRRFNSSGYSDGHFTKYELKSPETNFNYTYAWGASEYFEGNGKFKPNAKIGEYGVLATNTLQYKYSVTYHARDEEGNLLYRTVDISDNESRLEPIYRTENRTTDYTLVCFCKQESENRFRFTMFVDLNLNNLIYHGKSINTTAASAIKDASIVKQVTHDFSYDFPSAPGPYHKFTFNYVDFEGDPTNAFIVPLEQSTFYEVGVRNQLEIAYGSHFLVCNCWVAKKIKWYQTGFFKVIVGIVLIVIACLTWYAGGAQASAAAWAAYAAAAQITAAIIIGVVGALMILEGLGINASKIFTAIFGNSLGTELYNWVYSVCKVALVVISCMFPPLALFIAPALGLMAMQVAIDSGSSLGSAVLRGVATAVLTYSSAQAMEALKGSELLQSFTTILNTSTEIASGIFIGGFTSTVNTYASTGDLLEAFQAGAITFGVSSLTVGVQGFLKDFGKATLEQVTSNLYAEENLIANSSTVTLNLKDAVKDALIDVSTNPNTYEKLANLTLDEVYAHKLMNLENDYQEFCNTYQAVMDALNQVKASQTSTVTAEFVAIMQTNLGRFYSLFPDMYSRMTPDSFLTIALASGSDQLKASLGNVTGFVDSSLAMDGYNPYPLYYTQIDPTVSLI